MIASSGLPFSSSSTMGFDGKRALVPVLARSGLLWQIEGGILRKEIDRTQFELMPDG